MKGKISYLTGEYTNKTRSYCVLSIAMWLTKGQYGRYGSRHGNNSSEPGRQVGQSESGSTATCVQQLAHTRSVAYSVCV